MCVGGQVINTYSRQQKVIALSSTEAELYAIFAASAESLATVAYAKEEKIVSRKKPIGNHKGCDRNLRHDYRQ